MDKFFKTIKKYIKPISVFLLAIIITFALWALSINIRNADKVLDYYDRCTHQLIETTVKTKNYEVHSNFFNSYYEYFIISEYNGDTYTSMVTKEIYEHYDEGDKVIICTKHNMMHIYEERCD